MIHRYIYQRCSTDKQDEAQQWHCICGYLERNGISLELIDGKVTEHVSGAKSHEERELGKLLRTCSRGDYIYVSELSRLGRSMVDLSNIVNDCCERGVTIIQCKDGMQIENVSIGGKALLFALSLAAELELSNIRQRTQMKIDSIKQEIAENGGWVSKSGVYRTHLGSPKGKDAYNQDMSAAQQARSRQATERRIQSAGYKWVAQQISAGKTAKQIVSEFNDLHAISPDTFCAPKGGALTYTAFARWRKAILSGM